MRHVPNTKQATFDLALSKATKAYLDNFEFLERPSIDAGEREFMLEVEAMMRQTLRDMIRSGEPISVVNVYVDYILVQLDRVESILAE